MPSYALFGSCFESELPFEGLKSAGSLLPRWKLVVRDTPAPPRSGTLLGTSRVDEGISVHLSQDARGYRLEYEDTGTFDVNDSGRSITWYRVPGADLEHARLDILGRVMAIALHAGGDFCLHASAVLTPQGAIAFMAPKFHGKSTLAMALAHAGCPALTDDILPIGFRARCVVARPGVPQLRLWSDSARRLAPDRVEGHVGGKYTMDSILTVRASDSEFPLAALYILSPRISQSSTHVVTRHRLAPVQAALTLVGQAKAGELLGGAEAPGLLRRAVAVAGQAPMYRLEIVRDYDRLSEATTHIIGWHRERAQHTAASA